MPYIVSFTSRHKESTSITRITHKMQHFYNNHMHLHMPKASGKSLMPSFSITFWYMKTQFLMAQKTNEQMKVHVPAKRHDMSKSNLKRVASCFRFANSWVCHQNLNKTWKLSETKLCILKACSAEFGWKYAEKNILDKNQLIVTVSAIHEH